MKRVRPNDFDDFNEVKKKITTFKVQDLQNILALFNISKSGRKTELQDKLLSLFKNGSLNAGEKQKLSEEINCIYKKEPKLAMTSQELDTKRLKPLSSLEISNALPIQPDVRLKNIPFYDQLGILLQPTTLSPSNHNSYDQLKTFTFNLTPKQATDIERNRVINSHLVDYTIEVQLRLCLLEITAEQNDLFPLNLQVRVNNRVCPLPPFLPARPNTIPKRTSKPLNVTPFVKISPLTTNTIEVRWQKEVHKNFVIACFLVRKLSPQDLFQRIKVQGDDFTRGMIKEKLSKEIDSEIATTMLRVSLLCPLGKMRMKMPCRASTCKHLQCFDALLYLQMNECKQSWICPVCSKEALFENLVIDGYFLNVIKSLDSDNHEIQLHKDGSWSKLAENIEQIQSDEGLIISDEEDANNNKPVFKVKDDPKPVKPQKSSKAKNNAKEQIVSDPTETIDLTLDD